MNLQNRILSVFNGAHISRLEIAYRLQEPIQNVNQAVESLVKSGRLVQIKITSSSGKVRGGVYNTPSKHVRLKNVA